MTKESGLPFAPVGDVIKNAPPEPAWVWDGYIAPGTVSLLAGRPKVGKSTLMFGLIAAVLQGRPFAARATRGHGVLLLTEESADTLAEKARMFEIGDHPRFHALLRRQVQAAWPEIGVGARAYCREHELGVIIVDTFDKWAGLRGDDENKSGPTLQALEPLMLASGDGLAVIIISHQRKASGDHGEAVRGSNAITGAVDVIVELERVADVAHARALYGTSRFTGTPEELAVELTEDGYVARGDVDALRERLDVEKVLGALSGTHWITADGVAEVIEMPKATVHKRLGALHDEGRIERRGEGRKGSPYEWRAHSSQPQTPGEILSSQPNAYVTNEKPEAPEEYSSPAARDADVLELLHQAEKLGEQDQITLVRDDLDPLEPTVWMSRNGYDKLERSFLCRGTFADGRSCTFKRQPGRRYCRRHDPNRERSPTGLIEGTSGGAGGVK